MQTFWIVESCTCKKHLGKPAMREVTSLEQLFALQQYGYANGMSISELQSTQREAQIVADCIKAAHEVMP